MSDNEFEGESEQSTPNTKNTNQATVKSKALIVSSSRIVPSRDQDDELKGDEKISYAEIIRKVTKILPPNINPRKQEEKGPVKPKSGIEALSPELTVREDIALPQSPLVLSTVNYIQSEVKDPKAGWMAPPKMETFLAPSKYYKTYGETLATSSLPKLDSDASRLDISNPSSFTMSSKNLDAIEKQVRSPVAINSHADLFSSAAFQSLSSEDMDSAHLSRFLQAVAKSICHSVGLSVLIAAELTQTRKEAVISTSKILTEES